MEKTLSKSEMQTILDNRPKGVSMDDVINGYTKNGYKVEGINYTPEPSIGQKAKDVAVGFAKGAGRTVAQTASGLQDIGQGILGGAEALVTGKDLSQTRAMQPNMGFESLKQETPQGQAVTQALTPTNEMQKLGGQLEFGTEVLAGGGAQLLKSGATRGIQALAPQVNKVTSMVKSVPQTVGKTFSQKGDEFVLDLVSPKATTAIKQEALAQGRVSEPGLLKAGKILPSKRDEQVAEAVKDFVSNKATPVQNIDSIKNGVAAINNGVKDYVKANKVPFNTNQLKTQLNKGKEELNLIFASDTNAKKTYDAVVKEFIKHVKSKDTSGLLDARQEFDKIPAIKKLLDSQGLGENTRKEIVLTTRSMANRYIADLLPKGNQYRATLLKESKMIEALGNIADKNTGIIDANKLQLLLEEYPVLKWVIGGTATGLVGGASF